MRRPGILFGVCGIGNGHTYRQLPLIEHFMHTHHVLIFAYGDSLRFYAERFGNHPSITIAEVAVPYYPGNTTGLDFDAAAARLRVAPIQDTLVNCEAMALASRTIGRPALVVSDYEPVSAQYAYTYNAPLATVDQQSKYLVGAFPRTLRGHAFIDEVMRLRMFFPKAAARIAVSFFRVPVRQDATDEVLQYGPMLRPGVLQLKQRRKLVQGEVLVYLSAQTGFAQPLAEILNVLSIIPGRQFSVFLPPVQLTQVTQAAPHVQLYRHGDPIFDQKLAVCSGIIATAGHTLLSEAMYLGIPVLALPLPLYEQQMNAQVIATNGFGAQANKLTTRAVRQFVANLDLFSQNIAADTKVLLRRPGQQDIIPLLTGLLPQA